MPTFPIGHSAFLARLDHLRKFPERERAAAPVEKPQQRFEFPDPVDIRGIPAVGRGVAGIIRGTRPDAICGRDT